MSDFFAPEQSSVTKYNAKPLNWKLVVIHGVMFCFDKKHSYCVNRVNLKITCFQKYTYM